MNRFHSEIINYQSNETANNASSGLVYNPRTAKRAWQSMINFFNEIFG